MGDVLIGSLQPSAMYPSSRCSVLIVLVVAFIGDARHVQTKPTGTNERDYFETASHKPIADFPAPLAGASTQKPAPETARETSREPTAWTSAADKESKGTVTAGKAATRNSLTQKASTPTVTPQALSVISGHATSVRTTSTPTAATGTSSKQNANPWSPTPRKASLGASTHQTPVWTSFILPAGAAAAAEMSSARTSVEPAAERGIPPSAISRKSRTPLPDDNSPCFAFLPATDYDFLVTPDPQMEDVRHLGYIYNRGQNVTLTCRLNNASRKKESYLQGNHAPYVFIRSCSFCDGYFSSEPGRGEVSLTLVGHSMRTGSCMFSCWRYLDNCISSPTRELRPQETKDCFNRYGDARTIKIGDPPSSMGVTCVSRNWEVLTCTWTLRSGTQNWSRPRTSCSVTYVRPCDFITEPNQDICHTNDSVPIILEENGAIISARVTVGSERFTLFGDYSFFFRIKGLYGEVSITHNVSASLEIVKYDAAKNVSVKAVEGHSSLLEVSWEYPDAARGFQFGEVPECQLRVVAEETTWMDYNKTITVSDCRQPQAVVPGLHAHVKYRVGVRFKLLRSEYWSDFSEGHGTTTEDVPSAGPDVSPGGYTLSPCTDTQCLTVYWKELDPLYRNGIVTGYHTTLTGNSNLSAVSSADSRSVTFRLRNFRLQQGARACVSAATIAGVSEASSCLEIVPPETYSHSPAYPREVAVEKFGGGNESGRYVVEWNTTEDSSASADYFVVFWCIGTYVGATVNCSSDMNWSRVKPAATSFTICNCDMKDTRYYGDLTWRFGVTAVKENRSRGIAWNEYSFSDTRQKKVPDLTLGSRDGRKVTAIVTFVSDLLFSYRRPERCELYVRAISGEFEKEKKVAVVPGSQITSQQVFNVDDARSAYDIYARAFYADGKAMTSDPLRLLAEKGDHTWTVYVIIGSIVLAVFLTWFVCCLVKRKRRWDKLFSPTTDNIPKPIITKPPLKGTANRSFQLDSLQQPDFMETRSAEEVRNPPLPPRQSSSDDSSPEAATPPTAGTSADVPFVPHAASVNVPDVHNTTAAQASVAAPSPGADSPRLPAASQGASPYVDSVDSVVEMQRDLPNPRRNSPAGVLAEEATGEPGERTAEKSAATDVVPLSTPSADDASGLQHVPESVVETLGEPVQRAASAGKDYVQLSLFSTPSSSSSSSSQQPCPERREEHQQRGFAIKFNGVLESPLFFAEDPQTLPDEEVSDLPADLVVVASACENESAGKGLTSSSHTTSSMTQNNVMVSEPSLESSGRLKDYVSLPDLPKSESPYVEPVSDKKAATKYVTEVSLQARVLADIPMPPGFRAARAGSSGVTKKMLSPLSPRADHSPFTALTRDADEARMAGLSPEDISSTVEEHSQKTLGGSRPGDARHSWTGRDIHDAAAIPSANESEEVCTNQTRQKRLPETPPFLFKDFHLVGLDDNGSDLEDSDTLADDLSPTITSRLHNSYVSSRSYRVLDGPTVSQDSGYFAF